MANEPSFQSYFERLVPSESLVDSREMDAFIRRRRITLAAITLLLGLFLFVGAIDTLALHSGSETLPTVVRRNDLAGTGPYSFEQAERVRQLRDYAGRKYNRSWPSVSDVPVMLDFEKKSYDAKTNTLRSVIRGDALSLVESADRDHVLFYKPKILMLSGDRETQIFSEIADMISRKKTDPHTRIELEGKVVIKITDKPESAAAEQAIVTEIYTPLALIETMPRARFERLVKEGTVPTYKFLTQPQEYHKEVTVITTDRKVAMKRYRGDRLTPQNQILDLNGTGFATESESGVVLVHRDVKMKLYQSMSQGLYPGEGETDDDVTWILSVGRMEMDKRNNIITFRDNVNVQKANQITSSQLLRLEFKEAASESADGMPPLDRAVFVRNVHSVKYPVKKNEKGEFVPDWEGKVLEAIAEYGVMLPGEAIQLATAEGRRPYVRQNKARDVYDVIFANAIVMKQAVGAGQGDSAFFDGRVKAFLYKVGKEGEEPSKWILDAEKMNVYFMPAHIKGEGDDQTQKIRRVEAMKNARIVQEQKGSDDMKAYGDKIVWDETERGGRGLITLLGGSEKPLEFKDEIDELFDQTRKGAPRELAPGLGDWTSGGVSAQKPGRIDPFAGKDAFSKFREISETAWDEEGVHKLVRALGHQKPVLLQGDRFISANEIQIEQEPDQNNRSQAIFLKDVFGSFWSDQDSNDEQPQQDAGARTRTNIYSHYMLMTFIHTPGGERVMERAINRNDVRVVTYNKGFIDSNVPLFSRGMPGAIPLDAENVAYRLIRSEFLDTQFGVPGRENDPAAEGKRQIIAYEARENVRVVRGEKETVRDFPTQIDAFGHIMKKSVNSDVVWLFGPKDMTFETMPRVERQKEEIRAREIAMRRGDKRNDFHGDVKAKFFTTGVQAQSGEVRPLGEKDMMFLDADHLTTYEEFDPQEDAGLILKNPGGVARIVATGKKVTLKNMTHTTTGAKMVLNRVREEAMVFSDPEQIAQIETVDGLHVKADDIVYYYAADKNFADFTVRDESKHKVFAKFLVLEDDKTVQNQMAPKRVRYAYFLRSKYVRMHFFAKDDKMGNRPRLINALGEVVLYRTDRTAQGETMIWDNARGETVIYGEKSSLPVRLWKRKARVRQEQEVRDAWMIVINHINDVIEFIDNKDSVVIR